MFFKIGGNSGNLTEVIRFPGQVPVPLQYGMVGHFIGEKEYENLPVHRSEEPGTCT